jgi:hypothetical protein
MVSLTQSARSLSNRVFALSLSVALPMFSVACAEGEPDEAATVDRTNPTSTTPATVVAPASSAAASTDNVTAPVLEKPGAGDLVITEIMLNPKNGEYAQWFEVFNTSSRPRMLNGLILRDGRYTVTARDCYGQETRSENVTTIQDVNPIIVGAKSYAVLVRDRNTGIYTANVPANAIVYDYPTFNFWLDDKALGIYIYDGSYLLTGVNFGRWINSVTKRGASIQLKQFGLPSNDLSSYCQSWRPWAQNSEFGSPGKEADCQ